MMERIDEGVSRLAGWTVEAPTLTRIAYLTTKLRLVCIRNWLERCWWDRPILFGERWQQDVDQMYNDALERRSSERWWENQPR
jgi:hypothetical protein